MRGPRAALLVRREHRKMRGVHLRRVRWKREQLQHVGPVCGNVCPLRDERLRRRALRSGRGMCVRERGSGVRGRLRRRGRMPPRDPSLHVWLELRGVPRLQAGMRREVGAARRARAGDTLKRMPRVFLVLGVSSALVACTSFGSETAEPPSDASASPNDAPSDAGDGTRDASTDAISDAGAADAAPC